MVELERLVCVQEVDEGVNTSFLVVRRIDNGTPAVQLVNSALNFTNHEDIIGDTVDTMVELARRNDERVISIDRELAIPTKIFAASNTIAVNGYIGMGNHILINQLNYDRLGIADLNLMGKEVIINNSIENIIVYHRGRIEQDTLRVFKRGDLYDINYSDSAYKQFKEVMIEI